MLGEKEPLVVPARREIDSADERPLSGACRCGRSDGLLINVETKQPFTNKDTCVELGPHLRYDPNAIQAAKTAVKAFLRTVFKLD
jgi:predicted deacylase